MNEIHFYELASEVPAGYAGVHGWAETEAMIRAGAERVDTTQMGLLGTGLIENGYRVFVHPAGGAPYEIRLGSNDCTDKEIRPAHNLFRMWRAGAFSAD